MVSLAALELPVRLDIVDKAEFFYIFQPLADVLADICFTCGIVDGR